MAAFAAIVLFNLLLALGYSFSFSSVLPHFPLNTRFAMFMGAVTLSYLAGATVFVAVQLVWSALRRRLETSPNPGRRRMLSAAGKLC